MLLIANPLMELENQNKKVLIITYYWPPSGGAGVQRWLKFTKYLPDFGWEPIVFTPENPSFDLQDNSLENEVDERVDVLKFPIWEPYGLFKRISGTKELKQGQILEQENRSWLKSISIFLRGNLFIPDPRVFWVKSSVKYLQDIIVKNEIKHVITTGPPHSMHLIGLKLKYLIPSVQWLADFRDPWTQWDLMKQFRILPFVWNKHEKLEKEVLKVADVTIATGKRAAADLKSLGARKVVALTNGFDTDVEFSQKSPTTDRMTILHLGMLNSQRQPLLFFSVLNEFSNFHKEIALKFTGIISPEVKRSILSFDFLKDVVEFRDSLPHSALIEEYLQANVLLLLQTNSTESVSQLPGKLFEYLAQKKPILAFGHPNSDVAEILKETNSGVMLSYEDREGIESVVRMIQKGKFGEDFTYKGIEEYSRKVIASRLSEILESR